MKAQGLSMSTIIVAAICLIVLVVVIAIFTGNFKNWGSDVKSCKARGGTCSSTNSCSGTGETEIPNTDCGTKACCLKLFDSS